MTENEKKIMKCLNDSPTCLFTREKEDLAKKIVESLALPSAIGSRFEVHCYCKETYEKLHGHPENSYYFDNEQEAIDCITGLIKNKMSGIYITELVQNHYR